MRVDGSLNDLAGGVTTLDKNSLRGKNLAYEQINFRTDDLRGLIKRPPLELIGRIDSFDVTRDVIHYATYSDKGYFCR